MKFSFTQEKTTFIPVENQMVQVSALPEELKNEVETIDRLIKDKAEAIYFLEKIELALILKSQQVQQLVIEWVNQQKSKQEQAANDEKAINEKLAEYNEKTPAKKKK